MVLAGAALPPNPAALLESEAMESVLDYAKTEYDLVIIDTPPLTAVSDAFPLLGKVDGVVIVGWLGRNRRDVAERLRETLVGTGAPLLGVIANGFKTGMRGSYDYGYDYVGGVRTGLRLRPTARPPRGQDAPTGMSARSGSD